MVVSEVVVTAVVSGIGVTVTVSGDVRRYISNEREAANTSTVEPWIVMA